jgi:hypothetical protein
MTIGEVLHFVIEDELAAIASRADGDAQAQGMSDGLHACRGLEPEELLEVVLSATLRRGAATADDDVAYWAAYEEGVLMVAAVLSCALEYHGLPPVARITTRARMRYAAVVGYTEGTR